MSFLRTHIALFIGFVAVLVLMGVNIGVVLLPLGGFRLLLHLGTAVAMVVIVAALFMDLRHAGALMRVFALGGLLWLAFMWLLFPVDYFTR